jgi:hypothetical protein
MAGHKNKHIRAAIEYALGRGWRLEMAGPRAHIWGTLYCPLHDRTGCLVRVFSTPRVPEAHAADIRRAVDQCEHGE